MSTNEELARDLVGLKQDLVWITYVLERLEKKVDLIQKLVLDPPAPNTPQEKPRNLI